MTKETLCLADGLLADLKPVSLEEMSAVQLMNRTDTKYMTSMNVLPDILRLAENDYRIQEVDGQRDISYNTVYFDTPEKSMFLAHQCGRAVREKIRVRTYVNSGLTFLEVKNKNNKGRTDKKRIRVTSCANLSKEGGDEFLRKYAWYDLSVLNGRIENRFNRITLVNKNMTERLTIDTNVCFRNLENGNEAKMQGVVIIELKRDGNQDSPIREVLRHLHVRSASISKYCLGLVLTDPELKYNRFKPKLRQVTRIQKEMYNL